MLLVYREYSKIKTALKDKAVYSISFPRSFFSPSDFLFYKSHDIAEQMTLLDAELFQKIEVKMLANTICIVQCVIELE